MDYVPFVVTIGIACFLMYWLIRCCCTKRTQGAVIATPVMITTEVHRVPPGTAITHQGGTIIQGHPTGTAAYPAVPSAYAPPHPAPYMQHYPLQTSAAPATGVPPPQQPMPVQFPALPATMPYPPPPAASAPSAGAPAAPLMFNPPSYDQVVAGSYPAQAPYNPDFKG